MTTTLRNLLVIASLGLSGVASADDFYTAYETGEAAFNAKDYAKARAEFLKAYDLRPEPIVLYNIAQTYRLESNTKMAIDYYNRYLADSKSAEDLRKKAQNYVTQLQDVENKALEKKQKLEQIGPKNPDGTPANIAEPPRDRPTNTSPTITNTNPTIQADVVRKRRIPLASKIAVGAMGVGVVTSILLTKKGLGVESDFQANPMAGTAQDRVEKYQNLINLSWGLTGAAAVTAMAIYIAAPSYSTDHKTVVLAPSRDHGWTASLTGRF